MKKLRRIFCLVSSLIFLAFTVQAADPVHEPDNPKTEATHPNTMGTAEPAIHSFTGLIIDARGLGLEATFSPVIYDEAGNPVYGIKELDNGLAMSQGMADYAPTPELVQEAQNGKSRAGTHPLTIKAVGLKDNQHNVMISTADAEKILAADQSAHFLKQGAVVFLN